MTRETLLTEIAQSVDNQCDALRQQVTERRGSVTPRDEALIASWRAVEMARREAEATLEKDGLMDRYVSGRQYVKRENKALGQMLKAATTGAKLLDTLLPEKRIKAPEKAGDADVDEDALDDY